jgi:hypothetical protein
MALFDKPGLVCVEHPALHFACACACGPPPPERGCFTAYRTGQCVDLWVVTTLGNHPTVGVQHPSSVLERMAIAHLRRKRTLSLSPGGLENATRVAPTDAGRPRRSAPAAPHHPTTAPVSQSMRKATIISRFAGCRVVSESQAGFSPSENLSRGSDLMLDNAAKPCVSYVNCYCSMGVRCA